MALAASKDALERKSAYHNQGSDLVWLAGRVAELLGMEVEEVLKPGR